MNTQFSFLVGLCVIGITIMLFLAIISDEITF